LLDDHFKKNFDQYDCHHVRDPLLNQLFDALGSDINANRPKFSLAASIATSKRSRMSPEKLHATFVLKNYFKNQILV
jgi:hypothetical protein